MRELAFALSVLAAGVVGLGQGPMANSSYVCNVLSIRGALPCNSGALDWPRCNVTEPLCDSLDYPQKTSPSTKERRFVLDDHADKHCEHELDLCGGPKDPYMEEPWCEVVE